MKKINANNLVPSHDIVFITLDTLRFDIASKALADGKLPTLSHFIDYWQPRHSPATFTYAAHHAFFAGFLPTPIDDPQSPRLMAVDFLGSRTIDTNTKVFTQENIVAGLEAEGYATYCIGGVGFFNKQTPLGMVIPNMFQHSFWSQEVGVTDPKSTMNQVNKAVELLKQEDKPTFLFINISAIHQPNYFYLPVNHPTYKQKTDTLESHYAALCYVDNQLASLFEFMKYRRDTLFIICADHGTCYGDPCDSNQIESDIYLSHAQKNIHYSGHRLAHQAVLTVPYAHFIQEKMPK